MKFTISALALIPAVGAVVIASGLGARQDPPLFRSTVELVTVDATVIGDNGHPVATLGADDFTLKIDGQLRRVISAQFVRFDVPPEVRGGYQPRHFSSNEFIDPGRLVVLAVDEPHIRRTEGRAALQAAAQFIDRLDPLDRVAVIGLSRLGTVAFTRDRVQLRQALTRLTGSGDPVFLRFNIGLAEAVEIADGGRARLAEVVLRECGRALTEYLNPARAADDAGTGRDACPEQVEQEARAQAQHARTQASLTLSGLEALVDALKEFDRPKTLVLLTEGMVADPRLMDFSEFAARAQEARVSIYVLHMEPPLFEATTDRVSPTFLHDVRMRGDGLTRLAGSARGAVFRLLGSDPAPFERIERELAGHYLIAFEPLPSDRDGRLHRIDLSVVGGKGRVRARQSFRLPGTTPSAQAREADLVALLRSTRPAPDLPVRVATYSYAQTDSPDLRVVVSTEAETASGEGADVLLGYVLVDARGVIVASGAQRADGGRHAFSARVAPGTYTLRVAGIDPLGRRGLVERSFTAAVAQQNGLRVSDVILAPVPPRTSAPLQPVVDRLDQSRVVAYVEIASSVRGATGPTAVSFEVVDETSAPARLAIAGDMARRGDGWHSARAVLPVDGLTAGAYLVVARVMADGRELARATRPFTIP